MSTKPAKASARAHPQIGGLFYGLRVSKLRVAKRRFTKPARTYAEQVSLLMQRGMVIADQARAAERLQRLNYYRLRGYWMSFEEDAADHAFVTGTTFEQVLELYEFDRRLRLLMLDAIESIEVAVRAQWAYWLARDHGPHAHLDPKLGSDRWLWAENLHEVHAAVTRSQETFIRHGLDEYLDGPPVWAICEVIALGTLSKLIKGLRSGGTAKRIANEFSLSHELLQSWLHNLTVVRNMCAHHSRLFNRSIPVRAMRPRSLAPMVAEQWQANSQRMYNTFLICLHFMDAVAPLGDWRQRLVAHVETRPDLLPAMGFPSGWWEGMIWHRRPGA